MSSIFLITAMLLKSPIALAGGVYAGFLYIRKIKDKRIIVFSFLFLVLSLVLFILTRDWLVGTVNTGTSSVSDFYEWLKHYFGTPSFEYLKRQLKPPISGIGIVTTIIGILSFAYYLIKRKSDMLIFVISWASITYLFWLFVYGNNARHFMIAILPVIAMVVMFFSETAPRLTIFLTLAVIIGNYFSIPPSPSTYFPSGNLIKSQIMLQDRTDLYHSRARAIVNLNEEKIAVMGYYHNPYVIYEILMSNASYDAELLTSVRGAVVKIKTHNKEYMLCYIPTDDPEANINAAIKNYLLTDYIIVSATYDLRWLENRGIKTAQPSLLSYEYP
jgi:hypothetical protein